MFSEATLITYIGVIFNGHFQIASIIIQGSAKKSANPPNDK
jgi:hypothetical protein